jgi:hypothetical protein
MHTLTHGKFAMHFNSDLSGDVKIDMRDETVATIPGELLRMYVRKYVLGRMRDDLDNVIYRQLVDLGGSNHKDAAQIVEGIDHLEAVSTSKNPSNVLHGMCHLFGCPVHITFIRVEREKRGFWTAVDPAYADELQHVEAISGEGGGALTAVEVPGFPGDYIAYTYPHSE